jgi:hypothetical protein
VKVNKIWSINGTTYNEPAQPPEFQADLILSGESAPVWGQTYSDFLEGDSVTVGETVDMTQLPVGCTNSEAGDLGPHTLVAGLNTFTVRNTVTCETRLTLRKEIVNPYGPPQAALTAWTLSAIPPGGGAPIMSGTTGVNGVVQTDVKYSLAETTVAGYQQEVAPTATIVPPATGTWHCVLKLRDGTTSPEFDGLNGTVTVEIGRRAECTARNLPILPKLTLHKTVRNTHGGTAGARDWILAADPVTRLTGGEPISGRDGDPSITNAPVVPHTTWVLTENSGPPNYDQVGTPECVLTGTTTPVPAPGGAISLEFGQDVTCTFVNQDKVPPPPPPPGPDLPVTGSSIGFLLQSGGLLVVVGFGLVAAGRRRWA